MVLNKKFIGGKAYSKTMGKSITINEENKGILIKDGLTHLFNDTTKDKSSKPVRSNSKRVKDVTKS